MKIVNLEEFRKLPAGTVFSKYEPCVFDGLMVKGDTWSHDFLYQDLIGNIEADGSKQYFEKCEQMQAGFSADLDFDCLERDGLFEKDQLFAVYEPYDLEQLIGRLQKASIAMNKHEDK